MKKGLKIALVFSLVFLMVWSFYLKPTLQIATAYSAKYLCSYIYLSDIDQLDVKEALSSFPLKYVRSSVDKQNKQVVSSFLGLFAKQTATYYENNPLCGCVIGTNTPNQESLQLTVNSLGTQKEDSTSMPWPLGNGTMDSIPKGIDKTQLDGVLKKTLKSHSGVFAIVVAYKNSLIAEEYREGITKNSRILGWSMTKTIANALLGILEKNNQLKLDETTNIDAWNQDQRKSITLSSLLQMSSGLRWDENYTKLSDATRMLYLEPDIPAYAVKAPYAEAQGTKWYYSSGTTNILSKIIRSKFKNTKAYHRFPNDSLFQQLKMESAMIETDNRGNFVLSSYGWASARDWTKFGLLYLNKGNWFGTQIFSPEWADYSTSAATASKGAYGAQLWLNQSGTYPALPSDAYYFDGYGGQRVVVVPSKGLVITVMSGNEKELDFNGLFAAIIKCLDS